MPDFDNGHILHATGVAEIVWDGALVDAFTGAQRLIRFRPEDVVCIEGALPYRFRFDSYSGDLNRTGTWDEADQKMSVKQGLDKIMPLRVTEVERESDKVLSLWLMRADQRPLPAHEPGQFLPIQIKLPNQKLPLDRTYTISNPPGGNSYRLSIKDEGEGALVSPYLHAFANPGLEIGARPPRGSFVLDQESDRPAVFISAGIGITPMIAMVEHIALTQRSRPVVFLHGAKSPHQAAFLSRLEALSGELVTMRSHIRFSQGSDSERGVSLPHSEGRIDQVLLAEFLPRDEADYYLCGPTQFMRDTYVSLRALGVDPKSIRYEAFGPATVIGDPATIGKNLASGPVGVRFSKTGVDVTWTPESGTLLDLALAAGLTPEYACRSGVCGTCAVRALCGEVAYIRDPAAARANDQVLLCCSVPHASQDQDGCGPGLRLTIDL
ncbi:2Fe-2S iron-sulfur cluster-binding protein [Roseobacter insulae]|uniref:2Fe-2S iron-sulfur cluster-binding protein n=1 Tax=Roseobacter insulae TaxID=2859783 RepID=UPI00402BD69B